MDIHGALCRVAPGFGREIEMHRARQHAETRVRERRHRLAHEAARLMAEGGIRDFHQAKLKAASRLGILDDASLPRDRKRTRLNSSTNAHLVCRLLLEKKKITTQTTT